MSGDKTNEALDKMAENARELGLDYEPAQQKPMFTYDQVKAHIQAAMMSSAQRPWVGLTDEEVHALWMTGEANIAEEHHSVVAYEIEAKLREKNT